MILRFVLFLFLVFFSDTEIHVCCQKLRNWVTHEHYRSHWYTRCDVIFGQEMNYRFITWMNILSSLHSFFHMSNQKEFLQGKMFIFMVSDSGRMFHFQIAGSYINCYCIQIGIGSFGWRIGWEEKALFSGKKCLYMASMESCSRLVEKQYRQL